MYEILEAILQSLGSGEVISVTLRTEKFELAISVAVTIADESGLSSSTVRSAGQCEVSAFERSGLLLWKISLKPNLQDSDRDVENISRRFDPAFTARD